MLDCAIIRDLLPQYYHNTLSDASRAAIKEHTLTCPVCAGLLEQQNAAPQPISHKSQHKRVFFLAAIPLLLSAVLLILHLQNTGASTLLRCPDTGWSASVQQQNNAFTIQILESGILVDTISSPGTYESALWCPGGGFLAVAYHKDDHSCTMIYNTDSRVLRHLDSSFTQTLRYQNSAFSFLSGNTSAWEGMDYIPWIWSRNGSRLLLYGKGTAVDGWSYTGYFWYTPHDGTISDVTGFDSRFIDGENPLAP